ncbi:hypothetical protein JST97_03610 [bacterium]|nr:hypothetical protein [bacterium]
MAYAIGNNFNSFGGPAGLPQQGGNSMSIAIAITANMSEEQAAAALGQQVQPQPQPSGKAGKAGKHGKAGKNGKAGKHGKAGKAGKAGKCGHEAQQDAYSSPLHQGPSLNIAIAISGAGAGQLLGGGSAKQQLTNLIAGVLSQGQNQGMACCGMQPGFGGYMNGFGRAGF